MKKHDFARKLLSVILVLSLIVPTVSVASFALETDDSIKEKTVEAVESVKDTEGEEGETVLTEEVREIGDMTYHYSLKNEGMLVLDSVKSSKPLKGAAPEAETDNQIDWSLFDVDTLIKLNGDELTGGLVYWVMNHKSNESATFVDREGNKITVNGAANFNVYTDSKDYDLVCDACGYCLNGCTDGEILSYTSDDIDVSKTKVIDGVEHYFNTDGKEVGVFEKITYYYETTLSDGTVERFEEEKDSISYNTYVSGADDKCDVCGNGMCTPDENGIVFHDLSDDMCDNCGLCLKAHDDKNSDEICDICGRCTEGCADEEGTEIPDGKCDVCSGCMADHTDDNADGMCDICGLCAEEHIDAEPEDGMCDICDAHISGCVDETGAETGNGKCDVCGFDVDSCEHIDKSGSDSCRNCTKSWCEAMDFTELQNALITYSGIYEYLLSLDGEEGSQPYHNWLAEFKKYITADAAYTGSSIGNAVQSRIEILNAKNLNSNFEDFCESVRTLESDNLTAAQLIGTLTLSEGVTALDSENSYYGRIASEIDSYSKSYSDLEYAISKKYMSQYASLEETRTELETLIKTLAGEMLDVELNSLFAGYNKGKLDINDNNVEQIKLKVRAIDESLVFFLYGDSYTSADYKTKADKIWNGEDSVSDLSAKDRRCIEFALLTNIEYRINELKEAAFKNFKEKRYDEEGYYAIRKAMEDDLSIDEDLYVKDKDIQEVISAIDGFASSPEFMNILLTLMNANGDNIEVPDFNSDGRIEIYDFIMTILCKNLLFEDDFINMIFSNVYPAIFSFLYESLPKLLQESLYADKDGNKYTIDLLRLLFWGGTSNFGTELFRNVLLDLSATVEIDGGHAPKFKEVLHKAGLLVYPSDVANLLKKADMTKYADIIAVLQKAKNDDWNSILDEEGGLDFEWNVGTLEEFKDIISVVLASFDPLLETFFARSVPAGDTISIDNVAHAAANAALLIYTISANCDVGFKLKLGSLNFYQDIIAPIFEALGIPNFGTRVGDESLNYEFKNIIYNKGSDEYNNASEICDVLFDPLMKFIEQLATHPVEKLLSMLPNISLYLENGKLFDLFDIDSSINAKILFDFDLSIEKLLDGIWDTISKQIFKKWYDFLNPLNYVKATTVFAWYLSTQELFTFINLFLDDFDLTSALEDADVSKPVYKAMEGAGKQLPSLFEKASGMFGLDVSNKVKNIKWPTKEINLKDKKLLSKLNFYPIFSSYLTSADAVKSLGFDLRKPSTLIDFFFNNLVDKNGKAVHVIDTDLLDLDELAHLGSIEILSGSVRDAKYAKHWNTLSEGEYYYVDADTSDVFYFFVNLISGVLTDKTAIKTILSIFGMDYDSLAETISKLGDDLAQSTSIELNSIIKNAVGADGKISLDKILENMTTNNLLCIIVELMQGVHIDLEEMDYLDSSTKTEIDSNDGTIPYLEYDNQWTSDTAEFIAEDIDSFVDEVLSTVPLDLNPETEEIEKLREFIRPLLENAINNPDILTSITEALTSFYDVDNEMIFTLIEKATGMDLTKWANDFGYLFDSSASAPEEKAFEKVSAKVTGKDENGKNIVEWYYNGNKVETYTDIFNVLGEILDPVTAILDLVFCGKDFTILNYTKRDGETASTVTIKGEDGYNYAVLPLLEAMLPDGSDILTPEEFKELGTVKGFMKTVSLLVDRVFDIIDNDQIIADLSEMALQLMYSVSSNGIAVVLSDIAQPLFLVADYLRPAVDLDINEIINTLLCRFTYELCGYTSEAHMKQVITDNNRKIDIANLDLESIFRLIGGLITKNEGKREYLDVSTPYYTAMSDIAYMRKEISSVGYTKNEAGEKTARSIYKLDIDGKDSLTCLITMFIETLFYKSNPDVIDNFAARLLDLLGLEDQIISSLEKIESGIDWKDVIEKKGIIATLLSILYGIRMSYHTDYDWAYILGDDAADAEKAELLSLIKTEGSIKAEDYQTAQAKADYNQYLRAYDMTTWDEGTATWLVEKLGNMIDNVLNAETEDGKIGDTIAKSLGIEKKFDKYNLGTLAGAALPTALNDETIENVLLLLNMMMNDIESDEVKSIFAQSVGCEIEEVEENERYQSLVEINRLFNQYRDLIYKVTDVIGIDIEAYDFDPTKTKVSFGKVVYYNKDGEKTGLERRTVSESGDNFGNAVADVLKPLGTLLSWLLLGANIELFNNSGVIDGKERRDSAVNIEGLQLYNYMILPLLEAIGIEGLSPAEKYSKDGDGASELLNDILEKTFETVFAMLDKGTTQQLLDSIFDIVPSMFYYLNSGAIGVALDNTAGQIDSVLDIYNSYSGRKDDDRVTAAKLVNKLLDLNIKSFKDIKLFDFVDKLEIADKEDSEKVYHIYLSDLVRRILEEFTTGEIIFNNASVCNYDTYSMRYASSKDRAATITILASVLLDIIEDEKNAPALSSVLGSEAYETLINIFNLEEFENEPQDFTWLFKEYADTDTLLSAFDFSSLFDLDPYAGKLWTREMAANLADNLSQFINDMLYLLGLEINGIKISDFNTLLYALIGGTIYSNDMLNTLTTVLGQIKPLLDKYDPDGAIAGFVKELLDVDLHAWDEYAKGGKYENGRDWGFEKGKLTSETSRANSKIFENAISELLAPIAPLLTFVLCNKDFTFFADGDGLGKNSKDIQLTICGAEGYKYAIVPLFEAMNIDGMPDDLAAGRRDGDIYDPEEYSERAVKDNMYAIEGIVHPFVSKINDIMDSTATELLEILPSLVYFVNSNGIDTVVKNLIQSVLTIGNALEPMDEQIDALVFDEYGFNVYKTIGFEKIIKDTVYTSLGITEEQVRKIYATSGRDLGSVDGLEDIDFRLLFSIVLAALNSILKENGIPFEFTSIAASAIEELTYGYVVSFDSLSGRKAYTMSVGKEIDSNCLGDLLSILMRLVLKFLSVDNNSKALVELIKSQFGISADDCHMLEIFIGAITWYVGSLGSYEVAMLTIYYTIYGASKASGSGVSAYDHVNSKWAYVMQKLESINNPIAKEVIRVLVKTADDNTGDVIGSGGIAANGLFKFFQKIIDWFNRLFEIIRSWFG